MASETIDRKKKKTANCMDKNTRALKNSDGVMIGTVRELPIKHVRKVSNAIVLCEGRTKSEE